MARSEEEWYTWFKDCMLLHSSGFIPSDPVAKLTCPPSDVVAHWGEKEGRGYAFRDTDGEEYFLYVSELFKRVHQQKMVDGILPLHFARGLLEESRGGEVNWCKFAMIRCFPRWRRRPFEPLAEFADVNAPIPWTHPKVQSAQTGSESIDRSSARSEVKFTQTFASKWSSFRNSVGCRTLRMSRIGRSNVALPLVANH